MVNWVNDTLINLGNEVIDIVGKILDFNKQQKGKCLKILTHKQILKRLPIPFTQVKAGNTSENILNKIHQIIYSLYQTNKIPKNYITI